MSTPVRTVRAEALVMCYTQGKLLAEVVQSAVRGSVLATVVPLSIVCCFQQLLSGLAILFDWMIVAVLLQNEGSNLFVLLLTF